MGQLYMYPSIHRVTRSHPVNKIEQLHKRIKKLEERMGKLDN